MASVEDTSQLAAGSNHPVSEGAVQQPDADSRLPSGEPIVECPVCLQQCVYPVKLPCSHVFCFLCVKGVAGRSRRCALCRAEFPPEFVRRPVLVVKDEVTVPVVASTDQQHSNSEQKFHWYYEGVGGWWEYDERTSTEIENYRSDREHDRDSVPGVFELLIAGFIYTIDLDNSVQYRREYPRRRRRIKRDFAGIPDCKGVAGLVSRNKLSERRNGDGTEVGTAAATVQTAQASSNTAPIGSQPATRSAGSAGAVRSSQAASSAASGQSARQQSDVTERLAALDLSGSVVNQRRRRNGRSEDAQDTRARSHDRHQPTD